MTKEDFANFRPEPELKIDMSAWFFKLSDIAEEERWISTKGNTIRMSFADFSHIPQLAEHGQHIIIKFENGKTYEIHGEDMLERAWVCAEAFRTQK